MRELERARERERVRYKRERQRKRRHIHSDARERRRSDVERNERNGRDAGREEEMRCGGMRTGMKEKNSTRANGRGE